MKVQTTESGTWRRTLEVEVPAEAVEERFQAAYKTYSKSLNLPGFRKGRVPVNIVKARFGKAIQGEVLQNLLEEFYREASKAEGLHPVSEATIEEVDYDEGKPLTFKASVDIRPEFAVKNYKGLRVTRPVFKVEEAHIEEQLHFLQNQNATEQVVDRPAALGDVLVADLQELDVSGLPIIGRRQEDRTFLIGGPNATSHDLDNQLVGVSAGEERHVRLVHAEDHTNPGLAEQEVRFQVTAKEVRERNLPELDDEFAKDIGDFESLDGLKTRIRDDLQARADYTSRRRLDENIIDALIRQNDFEIPDSMVENYLNALVETYEKEHAGHDHDIDTDAVRRENREGALRSVKRYLLLEGVAKQEDIKVTEGDTEKHLEGLSERHNVEGPRLRQILSRSGQLERMESELLEQKTLGFLIEQGKIEDVEEAVEA
jgi:trigger factor